MIDYVDQVYSCCQLVAAINARIFCGGEKPSDDQIEFLVDVVKCRNGSAISIEDVYPLLDIEFVKGELSKEWINQNLPVELSIWHESVGFHSILVIGVDGDRVSVLNFNDSSILWEDLMKMHEKIGHISICKSFTSRV